MIKETVSPYLSTYMTKMISDILLQKKCDLPKLSSVFQTHKIFIEELQKDFSSTNKKKKLIIN